MQLTTVGPRRELSVRTSCCMGNCMFPKWVQQPFMIVGSSLALLILVRLMSLWSALPPPDDCLLRQRLAERRPSHGSCSLTLSALL